MIQWLKKIRILLTFFALSLVFHHTGLSGHLACEIDECCTSELDHFQVSSSPADHDHCLAQIPAGQREEIRHNLAQFMPLQSFVGGQILPGASENTFLILRKYNSIAVAGANFHFTHHVRLNS
jgi:hypothetical protein